MRFNQKNNIRIITPRRELHKFDVVSKVGLLTDGLTQEEHDIRVGEKGKYHQAKKRKYQKEYIYRTIYRLKKDTELAKRILGSGKNYPVLLKITEEGEQELARVVSLVSEAKEWINFRVCLVQPIEYAEKVVQWQEIVDGSDGTKTTGEDGREES